MNDHHPPGPGRSSLHFLRLLVRRYGYIKPFRNVSKALLSFALLSLIHPRRAIREGITILVGFPRFLEDEGKNIPDDPFIEGFRNIFQRGIKSPLRELVEYTYIDETRGWISDSLQHDPQKVYGSLAKRIKGVFEGAYMPYFVPFEVAQPQESLIEDLQSGNSLNAIEHLEGIPLNRILSLLPDDTTALVHLIVTEHGTFAVISQRQYPVETVLCSSATREKIENTLKGWMWLYHWHSEGMYQKTVEYASQRHRFDEHRQEYESMVWGIPHQNIFNNESIIQAFHPTEVPVIDAKPLVPFPGWLLMETILRELGIGYLVPDEGLWAIIEKKLKERTVARLIISPGKALALFPLHAVVLAIDGNGEKEFLLDRYEISYLPQGSLSTVPYTSLQPKRVLAIGTDGEQEHLSSIGVLSLCNIASGNIVTDKVSKPGAFNEALSMHRIDSLTFIGHGFYDWEHPEASSLCLVEKDGDCDRHMVLKNFLEAVSPQVHMVTLAACGIGLPKIRARMTGYRGFAEDLFLVGRVPTVVSTLWPVYQLSTVLLIADFHRRLMLESTPPNEKNSHASTALRQAQLWLKGLTKADVIYRLRSLQELPGLDLAERTFLDNTLKKMDGQTLEYPYAHPYFWSPFYVMGGIS